MSGQGRTLGALMAEARRALQAAGIEDAGLEVRLLAGGLLGLSTTELVTGADRPVSDEDADRLAGAIERRLRREPVHRILGRRAFHGLDLLLSPATLEPRPDTEILVDRILPYARRMAEARGVVTVLDMGTGTGAIGLAIAAACPDARVLLSDISEEALSTAAQNAHLNGLDARIATQASDWFSAIAGRFDMIVSNPPYIVTSVIDDLSPEVREFDPMAALDGGADGLDAYRAIAAGALEHLEPGGVVGLEIGHDQNRSVSAIFAEHGFRLLEDARDYGGRDRVLIFAGPT